MQLEGKRVVICGAGRGMGEASLEAFVAEGAHVVAMDIRPVDVTHLTGPGSAKYVPLDIGSRASVDAAFDQAGEHLGGLDVLVVTAVLDETCSAEDIDDELWDRTMRINVRGTVMTNQAAFRLMKPGGGGAIINFGSDAGMQPAARSAAYSTSKAAVHNWTRSIAIEWGPHGIRSNCVLPAIHTPLFDERLAQLSDDERERYLESLRPRFPLTGKQGDAKLDLAPVMVFLASDGSRFITGQLISVNGGLGMVR